MESGLGYSGAVTGGGSPVWYKLASEGVEWVRFDLTGKTPSCSVRATLLDEQGKALGHGISTTSEVLPVVVELPSKPVSEDYYVKVQANSRSCVAGSYVIKLIEPGQKETCGAGASLSEAGSSFTCESAAVPAIVEKQCRSARYALERVRSEVDYERHLVNRRRGSVKRLRELEHDESVDKQRLRKACR